jgi:hypothetical protein
MRGTGAVVVMRVGEGNSGIAVSIRFLPDASQLNTLSLISARTVRGETITGIAVSNFVDYEPPGDAWNGGAVLERQRNLGLFKLSVAPDGSVVSVAIRKTTGYPELDARADKWMRKWRSPAPHVLLPVPPLTTPPSSFCLPPSALLPSYFLLFTSYSPPFAPKTGENSSPDIRARIEEHQERSVKDWKKKKRVTAKSAQRVGQRHIDSD